MDRTATVSLVSYAWIAGDAPDRLTKTLEKMEMHIAQAAAQKADLVVFPEICSYLGAPNAWVFEELEGPTVTTMAAAAALRGQYECPACLATWEQPSRRRQQTTPV